MRGPAAANLIEDSDVEYGIVSEQVASFRRDGWLFLPKLLSEGSVQALESRLQSYLDEGKGSEQLDVRPEYTRLSSLSKSDDTFRELAFSRRLVGVAETLVRDRPLKLLNDGALIKKPVTEAGGRTEWHADFANRPDFDRTGGLTIWIALVDIDVGVGGLRFFTGSHRVGVLGCSRGEALLTEHPWLESECPLSDPLHYKPGDASVHDFMVVHGAGENISNRYRSSCYVSYIPANTKYTGAPTSRNDGITLTVGGTFDHLPDVS